MDRIAQANIDRFKLLLKTETDPTKRAMEISHSWRGGGEAATKAWKKGSLDFQLNGCHSICANASAECRRTF